MKIEIPESIKDILRCVECNELLSCGPVFLVNETSEAVCGRCSSQPPERGLFTIKQEIRNQTRNLQYEATAKLLSFPCRFSDQGCPEKIDFSADEPNLHERDCEFEKYKCPIMSIDCDWVGSRHELGEHCQDVHPSHFFDNPCLLPRPNLTESNLSNFLVSAYNFLFLVHIKICLESGNLFHLVRMFGDSKFLDKFSYSLVIEGNGSKIRKVGSVLRAGIRTIQEPTASCILISSLLDIFGGKYDESKFTVRIEALFKFCVNCFKNINFNSNSKLCDECRGKLEECKFSEKGCLFMDVNSDKCWKHEMFFCEYQRKCCRCGVNFAEDSLIEHLGSSNSHNTMKSDIGSVVRVKASTHYKCYYILFSSNNIGTIICEYKLFNSNIQLGLRTSLPLIKLKNFKCSIELTDPRSNYSQMLTPQIEYDSRSDWSIKEEINNFSSWENIGIDIKINIDKI